jgi:hypothetical protein
MIAASVTEEIAYVPEEFADLKFISLKYNLMHGE